MINISHLKSILDSFGATNEITSVQFAEIELELEDLLAQQRQADEAELQALQAREAELRVKLGLQRSQAIAAASMPPPVRPPRTLDNETDADAGINYDESDSGLSLRDETTALRNRSLERRRARGH